MITGKINYRQNRNYYNHANQKTDYDYWYKLMYHDAVIEGYTYAQLKLKYKRPTLQNRKDAYDEAAQELVRLRSVFLDQQKQLGVKQQEQLAILAGVVPGITSDDDKDYTDDEEEKSSPVLMLLIVAAVVLGVVILLKK